MEKGLLKEGQRDGLKGGNKERRRDCATENCGGEPQHSVSR